MSGRLPRMLRSVQKLTKGRRGLPAETRQDVRKWTTADLEVVFDIPEGLPPITDEKRPSLAQKLQVELRRRFWLYLVVGIPTLIAALYYFIIASDIYVSEARFIVRGPSSMPTSGVGLLLQSTGFMRSQEDTYSVQDFILSRDIVRLLEDSHQLRGIFGRPEADFVARFPNLITGASFEELYQHYKDRVEIFVDGTTGISILKVEAFRADDAQALASAILAYSEQFVNQLNDRARSDALRSAKAEVELSEARVRESQATLTAFRNREALIDPGMQSASVLELIGELMTQLTQAQAQLEELRRDAPNSPQIQGLRTRIGAIQAQIDQHRGTLTGGEESFAPKIAEYEKLLLEREFADRALASAIASLESARLEAQRQQLYLERVVRPNLADYALEPRRGRNVLVVFATALLVYALGWLLFANMRQHAQS